ncbi:MAG: SsrA-binding protein SmpB [Sphaerochaetaceae bacterium]
MAKTTIKVLQTNKKAYFNYEMVEDLEAGISLLGTEVKSIRQNRFSFADSYVKFTPRGLILTGLHISTYKHASLFNHDPDRERQLLVHKQEIKRLKRRVDEKGMTLIPTQIYLKGNKIKVRISLGRGKQAHDKRASIKERDTKRDLRRELKEFNR